VALERLQKLIARAGLASRRRAEELIVAGRVRVNGRVVDALGAQADPERDRIEVDGRRLRFPPPVTYVLYKPRGVVTTLSDPEGRRTVLDFMRAVETRVFPVGRLDYNTSGALLLTSDGELAHGLLHPRRHVPRVYRVKVKGRVSDEVLRRWTEGVEIDGRRTRPAHVSKLGENADNTWLSVTLYEGRNRQVHRMCEAVGLRLMRLTRFAFAGITIEGMRPGDYRQLDRGEIAMLRRFIARPDPRTRLQPPPAGIEDPVPEELRGEEDDGTWSAWKEGTIWELFDGGEPPAVPEAAVADGVVRRAPTDGRGGEALPPPLAEPGERPRWSGRLPGSFDDEDEEVERFSFVPGDGRREPAGGATPAEPSPAPPPAARDDAGRRPGPSLPPGGPDRPFRRRGGNRPYRDGSPRDRDHPPRGRDRPYRDRPPRDGERPCRDRSRRHRDHPYRDRPPRREGGGRRPDGGRPGGGRPRGGPPRGRPGQGPPRGRPGKGRGRPPFGKPRGRPGKRRRRGRSARSRIAVAQFSGR